MQNQKWKSKNKRQKQPTYIPRSQIDQDQQTPKQQNERRGSTFNNYKAGNRYEKRNNMTKSVSYEVVYVPKFQEKANDNTDNLSQNTNPSSQFTDVNYQSTKISTIHEHSDIMNNRSSHNLDSQFENIGPIGDMQEAMQGCGPLSECKTDESKMESNKKKNVDNEEQEEEFEHIKRRGKKRVQHKTANQNQQDKASNHIDSPRSSISKQSQKSNKSQELESQQSPPNEKIESTTQAKVYQNWEQVADDNSSDKDRQDTFTETTKIETKNQQTMQIQQQDEGSVATFKHNMDNQEDKKGNKQDNQMEEIKQEEPIEQENEVLIETESHPPVEISIQTHKQEDQQDQPQQNMKNDELIEEQEEEVKVESQDINKEENSQSAENIQEENNLPNLIIPGVTGLVGGFLVSRLLKQNNAKSSIIGAGLAMGGILLAKYFGKKK